MIKVNGSGQVSKTQQTKSANQDKTAEKSTNNAKKIVGGLLAGAAAFCGIAYAIKKKPAKITELLEQAKNLGKKNADEIKKAAKKVSGEVQNVADDAQKVTQKATEVVQDTVDDVAKKTQVLKEQNLKMLQDQGIVFKDGIAKQNGELFTGRLEFDLPDGHFKKTEFKNGKLILAERSILTRAENAQRGIVGQQWAKTMSSLNL